MKVSASIRRFYEDQKAINERLKLTVDQQIMGLKKSRWHYESRVKSPSSFALKVESGRFRKPEALEDFFACTLVVSNASEIEAAERLICERFLLRERRPQSSSFTHKASDAFPFDDLRLYVAIEESPAETRIDLVGVVFEVQVKTFLQHAWSIATHDLMYKTDDVDWSKERIAFQVKAMLEHAEISIQNAELLAASGSLAKEHKRTEIIKQGIELLRAQWSPDELPHDVRRLSQNITTLIAALCIDLARLHIILDEGKAARAGTHPTNLSPYGTIVQYLLDAEREKMLSLLEDDRGRFKVLIPIEVELPSGINSSKLRNALFVAQEAS